MKIIDKNIAEQTRGIFRNPSTGSGQGPNEWRDIPPEEGSEQVLTDEEILELSELILKIERHYGFPVDVEWARDGAGKFFIVQSRPITTLTNNSSSNEASDTVSRLTDVHTFELVCAFPFFPVLTLEPMPYGYEKNPYYEKIGVPNGCRVAVGILDTTYEGWIDRSTMPVISDPNIVAQIERDTREYVPKTRALLSEKVKILEHWNADTKQLETLVIETSRLMSETYQLFGAYLDDSLVTTDETMIHNLQQGRLELDYLATDYFTLHDKILTVFENTYGYPKNVLERCTTAELLAIVRNEVSVDDYKHIATRPYAIVSFEGKIQVLFGDDVVRLKQRLHAHDPHKSVAKQASSAGLIRGQVGNKGTAQGKICLLEPVDFENRDRIKAIEKQSGCILVTSMTRPELVPHLQNVAAFVTNEGGITCHAAIIAREMGKPCIIGTKIATQVLHDGDLVEVDAEKGVVRVLERAAVEARDTAFDEHALTSEHASQLYPADYRYAWGGQGFSMLFQSLFNSAMSGFDFFDSFCVARARQLRVYWSHDACRAAAQEGLSVFTGMDAATAHCESIATLSDAFKEFKDAVEIDADTFRNFLHASDAFLRMYLMLDPEFTDRALEQSGDKKLLAYLGEQKNKYREVLNNVYFVDNALLPQVLELIGRKLNCDPTLLSHQTADELYAALQTGVTSAFVARDDFAIHTAHGHVRYTRDQAIVNDLWERFGSRRAASSIDTLQGTTVAKKTVVRGEVKKLDLDYTDLSAAIQNLNSASGGFVFVADHTTPELVPVMRRSKAIITDMGGLLSHAAITARELNLPCVVGVTGATQVLHDGDLVEVDAEKGVVTILERAT